jgi:hypothetical protein
MNSFPEHLDLIIIEEYLVTTKIWQRCLWRMIFTSNAIDIEYLDEVVLLYSNMD